ncbi:MAG: hypothetical protein KKF98_14465 [Bacteroidetes bacterium]|nr:hypothetical protein [Bacteroidota bacterium]
MGDRLGQVCVLDGELHIPHGERGFRGFVQQMLKPYGLLLGRRLLALAGDGVGIGIGVGWVIVNYDVYLLKRMVGLS